jgi:predicted DNA binding protein
MWVAKFEFDGSNIFFGETAKKFNINLTGYPVSSYEKQNKFFINLVGTIQGNEKQKQKILKYFSNSKYIKRFEEKNNIIVMHIEEDKQFKPFYSPSFIYITPVKISQKGIYTYLLGSFYRQDIETLLKIARTYRKYKLHYIRQEKINNLSIIGITPNLTEKQKKSYELAVHEGYYEYPKRIELKQLAKISKISYSTFQQHLKYAEKKLSRFFVRQ